MKITAMTALVVIAGVAAQAGEAGQAAERKVTVCMESDTTIGLVVTVRAKAIASKMFSGIGVALDWRRKCPAEGIRINLPDHSLAERLSVPPRIAYQSRRRSKPYCGRASKSIRRAVAIRARIETCTRWAAEAKPATCWITAVVFALIAAIVSFLHFLEKPQEKAQRQESEDGQKSY
jgi:hypothetical protein